MTPTEFLLIGLAVLGMIGAGVVLIRFGQRSGYRRSADRIEALELLLAKAQKRIPIPASQVARATPHVHSFTIEPQRTDGPWGYWSCYLCKAVQARELVGT